MYGNAPEPSSRETITPETAQYYLEVHSTVPRRPLDASLVEGYAQRMKDGRWPQQS
jgi:hypothetical protein